MTNMSDIGVETLVMGSEELRSARGLSIQGLEPPLRLPGYDHETFLGKGAFGEAWSAYDNNSGRRVVIKFFNRRGGLDWSLLAREVDKLRSLFSDRRMVQLFAVGWDASPPYYVMEYLEGGSLEELLRAGPPPIDRSLELFRDIAIGLAHAHGKGIIHCDLKPANILLDQYGNPKLADFGQSRLSHEQAAALGTLFYMAPEQADLNASPDARWDVYALGAVLYHMLTGSIPFRNVPGADAVFDPGRLEDRLERYRRLLATAPKPTAHRYVPGVDTALANLVDRCLAIEPKSRFRDVGSVLQALDARATRLAQRPLYFLGILGPVLVIIVMALFAAWTLDHLVNQTRDKLASNAIKSDRFAAQLLAERFALEVENRWQELQFEAADPRLRRLLAVPAGSTRPEDLAAVQHWIADRRAFWNRRYSKATAGRFWFALDRDGILRTITPDSEALIGKYFGYRNYFHGGEKDLGPDDPPAPPITHPHRSSVYVSRGFDVSQGTGALSVTFSVPVHPPGDDNGSPVGILAMETEVGHFTEFQGKEEQASVLIDVRPDNQDRRGQIVAHPHLEELEGYDLRLVSWGNGSGVPTSGQSLVVAGADSNGLLHIRTFDPSGVRTDTYEARERGVLHLVSAEASGTVRSDTPEGSLPTAQAQAITDLKQRLPSLLPPHGPSNSEKAQAFSKATLIIGQTQLKQTSRNRDKFVDPDVVKRAERILSVRASAIDTAEEDSDATILDYHDPLDKGDGGGLVAALEPVMLRTDDGKRIDSGWVVIVQERYTEDLKNALRGMGQEIIRQAVLALTLVVLVIAALWAFVLLVVQQGRRSPWLVRWRQWWGLPTLTTASTSSVSASAASSTRSTTVEPSPAPNRQSEGGRDGQGRRPERDRRTQHTPVTP